MIERRADEKDAATCSRPYTLRSAPCPASELNSSIQALLHSSNKSDRSDFVRLRKIRAPPLFRHTLYRLLSTPHFQPEMPAERTKTRRAAAPVHPARAAAFEQDNFEEDDEALLDQDSEEDEWDQDRQAGPSRISHGQDDESEEEQDGVAAFESDPGEEIIDSEDDADPEVRSPLPGLRYLASVLLTDPCYRPLSGNVRSDASDNPKERADLALARRAELASIPFTSLLKAQKQLNKAKQKTNGKGKAAAGDEHDETRKSAKAGKGKGKGKTDAGRSNKHA